MPDPLFSVVDEVVVISGVSGQLGCRYAHAFLKRGAMVMGLDLKRSQSLDELSLQFPDCFSFFECNVTLIESLREALAMTRSVFGDPSVLINNAAIDSPPNAPLEENGAFEDYPDASWDRVMDVNVKGVYLACKIFGSVMASNKRGSIINISSIYGVVSPDQSIYEYRRQSGEIFFKPIAYAVSKSALLNLTRYLATYWARTGVRVNTLVLAGVEDRQAPEFLKAYCARMPLGRMADKDEYNGAVIFLASAASSYMNGAQLIIDGGWTAI